MQCDSCGKQADRRYRVVKTLPSGKHEEMSVCQRCRPSFQKIEDLFEMGGKIYTDAERPPAWHNEAPLPVLLYRWPYPLEEQLPLLPLDDFPLIEDFDVVLEGCTSKHEQEDHLPPRYYARFFSPSRGFLALLLPDEPEDLCQPDFVIPSGDFNAPYDDLDQGWNILIMEDHEYVYIITGNWEIGEAQRTWFKVERNLYYRQWEKTIQRCRALCSQPK